MLQTTAYCAGKAGREVEDRGVVWRSRWTTGLLVLLALEAALLYFGFTILLG
jgi:hypothetical protein